MEAWRLGCMDACTCIDRLRGHGAELQAELDLAKEALAAGK